MLISTPLPSVKPTPSPSTFTTDLPTSSIEEPTRSCSLTVRQAQLPTSCCLLWTKEGHSLQGGAIYNRCHRLKRLGILVETDFPGQFSEDEAEVER